MFKIVLDLKPKGAIFFLSIKNKQDNEIENTGKYKEWLKMECYLHNVCAVAMLDL